MGLTSAHDTPRQEAKDSPDALLLGTPNTPTPHNFLDIRKPIGGATSVKEHERAMEELKDENFDLKLRLYRNEEQLRQFKGTQLETLLDKNGMLSAENDALKTEVESLKRLLVEASADVELARRNHFAHSDQAAEIERLRLELEMSQGQLHKSQSHLRFLEEQMNLFDKESIEGTRRIKQLEMDLASAAKKIAESARTIEGLQEEKRELLEEIQMKNNFVEQVKTECQELQAELQTLMHQKQEAENRARIAEHERDNIRAEMDPARRRLLETVGPQTPGSPRSSIDLVESRLMKQVGAASKQMEMMAKSNALSQSERETLLENTRKLTAEINGALRNLMVVFERIAHLTGISPVNANGNFLNEVTLERAVDELNKIVEVILRDYDDCRRQKSSLADDLRNAHQETALLQHTAEKYREQAAQALEQLATVEKDLDTTRSQLTKAKNEAFHLEQQLKATNELELPKYREQCVTLQNAVKTLENELAVRERRLAETRGEMDTLRRCCVELENQSSKVSADSAGLQEEVATLRSQKQELLQKLLSQEELVAQTSALLDDTKQQLAKAERVKAHLQENFNREMREMHSANSDLKAQLAAISSGKSTNDQRLERLQAGLRFVEQSNDELKAKLQAKEAAHSALLRDHEILIVEKQNLERELQETQETIRRGEAEIGRLKRQELASRRGHEGLEHLQAKVDSLTSLNAFLKEQVEAKERSLRESEEKLRRQDDEIRRAYSDCEHQHQKIKKREMVIGRVLKRLENINAVAGLGGLMEDMPESPTKDQRF